MSNDNVPVCPTCGSAEPSWDASCAYGTDDVGKDGYPSGAAMEAAVELEVHAALGRVQTATVGKIIQRAIDKAIAAR